MPRSSDVPRVQVVREHGRRARPLRARLARPLRARLAGVVPSLRPLAERTILVLSGFLPLLAAVGLIVFLAWAMALGQSP